MTEVSKSLRVTSVTPDKLSESAPAQWTSLADEEAPPANPFMSPLWVLGWYECFVKPANRQILLLYGQGSGTLVGVAPMHWQVVGRGRIAFATRLAPVVAGVGPNPFEIPGLLIAAGRSRKIVKALVLALLGRDTKWCEITLPDGKWFEPEWMYNLPTAVAFSEYLRSRLCIILPIGATREATRNNLKRNVKESVRRSQNRIAKSGRTLSVVHRTLNEVDEVTVHRFLDLHHCRSRNAAATVQHPDAYADGRHRALLQAVVPKLAAQGRASIFELVLNNEVVAE